LKGIQQFETVAQNGCTKPIWQSHMKNTIKIGTLTTFQCNPFALCFVRNGGKFMLQLTF
jgi:hypothetical protein